MYAMSTVLVMVGLAPIVVND